MRVHKLRTTAYSDWRLDRCVFTRTTSVDFLVRGLRAYSDFEYEFRMALVNRKLIGIETSFLMADEKNSHISSSLIRELAHFGKTLPEFVPESIQTEVYEKLGVPYHTPTLVDKE